MMFKYLLMILAVCICRLAAAHPLPVPENPTTDSVLAHYKHLPYHLRQSAYEACTFFNKSVADHKELAIINAEGQEFENLEKYKASLEPAAQERLMALETTCDGLKGQPAWIYANPYMLFFWGIFSNHASFQKREAENLHNLVSEMGYDRDNHIESESENINIQADQRAQQFWSVVGEKVDLANDQDNPYAQLIKGLCYVDGISLGQDVNRGLHLIKRAANQHLLPALEFLTVYLKGSGQVYVGQGPGYVLDLKQLQRYDNYAKALANPFNKLNEKVAALKEIKEPLSATEVTELRLKLSFLPESMLSGEELISYQVSLQRGLKKLFGPPQHDFKFSKKDAYQLATWSLIIFAHLVDKSDLETALFYSITIYSILLNVPVMALHFRHHLPYGFSERKRQYRLSQFDMDQRGVAAQLLSYRLIAASIKKREPIPVGMDLDANQNFLRDLVGKVGKALDRIKYEKDKTLYRLCRETCLVRTHCYLVHWCDKFK